MKLALISLAVFAVAYGAVLPRHATNFGLKQDFNKFIDLLPKEDIVAIAIDYIANDEEVQEVLEYILSEDFGTLILDVEDIAEYQKFLRFLEENGLNVYYYLQQLHDILNLPAFEPRAVSLRRGTGIRGLVNDIKAILPLDKLKALYFELSETSPAFANFIKVLKGDDFKSLVQALRANAEFKKIIQGAKDHGLDINQIVELLNNIFGWEIETRMTTFSLNDDLNDFLALLPVNEIVGIVMNYLADDEEVQEVFEYMQSEEFKQLVTDVENVKEYIEFLNYLQSSGLNVYQAVNFFHDLLGLKPLPVPQSRLARKGLSGFIDEIIAVLPLDKLEALFNEKMATSPEFVKLFNMLKGEEFKGMMDKLHANPTFKDILVRLKAKGLDVEAIIEMLESIFGWGKQTRMTTFSLNDDLNDFLALLPVNEIVGIVMNYLADDEEVQEVFEYMQSEEFKQLVTDVENVKEYIEFLNYLQSSGLNVYQAVNFFHDLLGLKPLPVPQSRLARKGLSGFIDEIIAVLPLDKLEALFNEKMATSPEFVKLFNMLKGEEFKGMMDKLHANPTFKDILVRLKAKGLDVEAIIEMLESIFGWGKQTRMTTFSLNDDLNDFLALLPVNEIVGIVMNYLADDEEVQEVFEYMQSEEFKQLVTDVENVKEYIEFLNYLQSSGLNVYQAVNFFHDLLGLKPLPVPQSRLARKGLSGFIDEIIAVLPLDKLEALFNEKMATSPEFVKLFNMLKGEEFKGMMDKLHANPTFKDILVRLKAKGLDVEAIIEMLESIFGWGKQTRMTTFSLNDDLNDFLALLPVNEIVGIVMNYLADDEEVQEVFEYMQSEEFKQLVTDVENVKEYIEFLNYLQSSGLNVYQAVNFFHDLLGLKPLPVPQSRLARKGLSGFIDEIIAVLPLDKLEALFNEKMETSPEFVKLFNMLKGEEFKGMMDKLHANPTFKDILVRLKAKGLDVEAIIEMLESIFGWGKQTRMTTFSLEDDAYDFLALLPLNDILSITMEYLALDEGMQEVIEYFQSEDFKQLIQDLENIPEIIELLDLAQSNGFDVYSLINLLHDALGLEPLSIQRSLLARSGAGLSGFLEDIIAVLPLGDLEILFHEKLETSPEFAKLYKLITGAEVKGLIEKLEASPAIHDIIERLNVRGIDIQIIVDLVKMILEWGNKY